MMEKFAAQILSMTNQCNLRCSYCDWEKHEFYKLTEQDLINAKDNISAVRTLLDTRFPSIQLIEYSGGEVTLYPELLDIMLSTFSDKWFRIVTNGTLINDNFISKIKNHGKVFIALSLDGNSIESNKPRFGKNVHLFHRVLNNLGKLLKSGVPVMLLCTINSVNISKFHEYVRYLDEEYREYIENGTLFIPAHYVFNYSGDNGTPTREQELKFTGYLDTTNDLVVKNLKEHYKELSYFVENRKHLHRCHIPEWCLPLHFRGNSILEHGVFHSFGCGMRGKLDFGDFSIHDVDKMVYQVNDSNLTNNVKYADGENCENYCFVDWYIVDLILQGKVRLEIAQKWFVFFRDKNIIDYIKRNELNDSIESYSFETKGTHSVSIHYSVNSKKGTIESIQFVGGCEANLKGISALARGMKIEDVIGRLKGIDCQNKGTSCPDQLACALENYLVQIKQ